MHVTESRLTIVFDPPVYRAVFEAVADSDYAVATVILGPAAPTLPQIAQMIVTNWSQLVFRHLDQPVTRVLVVRNPKRRQRAARQSQLTGVSQRAHTVMSAARHTDGQTRRTVRQRRKQERATERYAERQAKKQARKRGH